VDLNGGPGRVAGRNAFRETGLEEMFDCVKCAGPCECRAVVMRRSLYGFGPDDVVAELDRAL
jgi:hypothetical protein